MRLPPLVLAALAAATLAAASPTLHDANPACDVCRWAWQSAQDALADPDTQRAVLRFVEDTACGAVPGAGADQCKQLAREYVPSAIAALESFTPGEACSSAGVCPSDAVKTATAPPARRGCGGGGKANKQLRGLPCPMCRLTLNNIKLQLEDPANQKDLVDKARTVCAAMPADVGAACNDWVSTNSKKVFAVIADFDPNSLCSIVGACPPTAPPPDTDAAALAAGVAALQTVTHSRPSLGDAARLDDDQTCATCKSIVASLAAAVADDARDAAAVAALKNVCAAFHTFRADCVKAIDDNAAAVVGFLKAQLTPDLCSKFGACPPAGLATDFAVA